MTASATRTAAYAAAGIADIAQKVRAGTRLDFDDGVRLFTCPDVVAVGALADEVRERLHGDVVWYNRNLHVNATNVCEASCIFCSFARLETGDENAWTMSTEDALRRIRVLDDSLVTEVHIVNGLNPDLPYDYYLELMRRIKAHRPDIHVKGFTAVEIHYYAEKYGMTVPEVLRTMVDAGLDSMPGGGAEIFHPRARRKLCHDKVDADGWLAIHEEAHRQGIFTNCTMLFGSIETTEERVDHLIRLRELQDKSLSAGATDPDHGGAHFRTFIPLRFHNDNNRLARLASPTGWESLRTIAVSRLLLDNIPHVKAYWPMLGTHEAQTALWFGASDLDGTVREEHIYHMAGAETPNGLSRADLLRFIRHAGRIPAERDTLYNVVHRNDAPVALAPSPVHATVGLVDYANARPLTRHIDGITLKGGHPSDVARWLDSGEVDIALLPVGALLSDAGPGDKRGFRIVPDLCIGSEGAVDTVLLVSEVPPEQWTSVRLDGVSRTSVLLARLLLTEGPLAQRLPAGIPIVDVPAGTATTGAPTDAALVIGDAAHALPDRFTTRLDLGALWTDWTGLPFVFAVWAGRPDVDPRVVDHLRAAGLAGVAELSDPAHLATLDAHQRTYLTERIRYPLDDRALMGLRRFASLALRAGLTTRETFTLYPPSRAVVKPRAAVIDALLARTLTGEPLPRDAQLQLLQEAQLPDLLLTAARRRATSLDATVATYGTEAASWTENTVGEAIPASAHLTVRFGAGETDPQLLDHLRALATTPTLRTVRFQGVPNGGEAVPVHDNTATRWLRVTALARLLLPAEVRVAGGWERYGRGLGQVALRAGAEDYGAIREHKEGAMVDGVWPMSAREAERILRLTGLRPHRRDAAFEPVGEALTRAEDRRRPLRRLDRPTP